MRAVHLRCEYATNPIGIDAPAPRLSWQGQYDDHGAGSNGGPASEQSAWQIAVAASLADLEHGHWLWDSGKVDNPSSLHHAYGGPKLQSGRRYYWMVRVWDGDDQASPWSEPAFWEMGLLQPQDWHAQWITPDWEEDLTQPQPPSLLRTEFSSLGPVQSARLYVTSLGLYAASLNGRRVGDWQFTPGWTSYGHRLQVQTYDVTALVLDGPNALGVTLADGWYRGWLGWVGRRNAYGDRLGLLLQLHLTYADGRRQVVTSDARGAGWRAAVGPIRLSDIYMGETYDARLERTGWDCAGYDDRRWSPVRRLDPPQTALVAQVGPPVRGVAELRARTVHRAPSGETIVDFGQNLTGRVRLAVRGPAGTEIVLRHAEILDPAGELYVENLRSAAQTDRYILAGDGLEQYEPHFTFHGFRYVGVTGWPGDLTTGDLAAIVLHSDMAPTGHFECSHPLLNQLQHNIVWGQRGNFLDVPTDCPQRDERLGWTGDAQVFARTAAFNYDVAAFFSKWLHDLAADQWPDGAVPYVIPDALRGVDIPGAGSRPAGATGWGDAAVIVPYTLYLAYGDKQILADQYKSMVAWVEYMHRQPPADLLFGAGFHFGDWLALDTPVDGAVIGGTDRELIGTAFFAYSARLLSFCAYILGKERDHRKYAGLSRRIAAAFRKEFLTPAGRLASNTQTAYVLALKFDLLSEPQRAEAVRRLAADIRANGGHLTTGFLGTPYLADVLADHGELELAYALLLREEYPSWLYPIKQGATTIWERWDGLKPDGAFQNPGMNSFNHYAYGAIGDWLYRVVAGLDICSGWPACRRAIVEPRPGGGLTWARASLASPIGEYSVHWRLEPAPDQPPAQAPAQERMSIEVKVPCNGSAEVHLPGVGKRGATVNGHALARAAGVSRVSTTAQGVELFVGAGTYHFVYEYQHAH